MNSDRRALEKKKKSRRGLANAQSKRCHNMLFIKKKKNYWSQIVVAIDAL